MFFEHLHETSLRYNLINHSIGKENFMQSSQLVGRQWENNSYWRHTRDRRQAPFLAFNFQMGFFQMDVLDGIRIKWAWCLGSNCWLWGRWLCAVVRIDKKWIFKNHKRPQGENLFHENLISKNWNYEFSEICIYRYYALLPFVIIFLVRF